MATTTVSYDGDGVQVDFGITFAYTAQSFVQVFVDAVLQVAGIDYDFNSPTVIRFQAGSIPPTGTNNVELRRVTGTAPIVDWEAGASVLDTDLDLADLQLLHVVEELENNVLVGMGKAGANWDAEDARITDLAEPILDSDAATKGSIVVQVAAADASAAAAEISKILAGISSTSAGASQTLAQTFANSALDSAGSIFGVLPVENLTVGRTLVVSGGTDYEEKRTRVQEFVNELSISGESSHSILLGTAYTRYILEIINYRPGTDSTDLLMTISDDDESTFENTGYDLKLLELKGSLANSVNTNQTAFKLSRQTMGNLGTFRENYSIEIKIFPGDGTEPFNYMGSGVGRGSDNSAAMMALAGIMRSTVTAVRATHIKIAPSTGVLGSGTILLWGIR